MSLSTAPVLSTASEAVFEAAEGEDFHRQALGVARPKTGEVLSRIYELDRTAGWVRERGARRVALQFPDGMLPDSVRVAGALGQAVPETAFYILADTSYGSCCVDELAAEHADADAVVHYGRSCLSPTARLPCLWVYTTRPLGGEPESDGQAGESVEGEGGVERVVEALTSALGEETDVVLAADLPFQYSLKAVAKRVVERKPDLRLWRTKVVHGPGEPIPNRAVVPADDAADEFFTTTSVNVTDNVAEAASTSPDGPELGSSLLFHLGMPPTALLLTLHARVGRLVVFDPAAEGADGSVDLTDRTGRVLARRYGTILQTATAGVWGILVNTLSVREYGAMVASVRERLSREGKKAYTVVVGKLNPAKMANFAEIEAWVVVGCWESSLVESGASASIGPDAPDYWRPLLTPFEMTVALTPDYKRTWTGDWTADLKTVMGRRDMLGLPSDSDEEQGGLDDDDGMAGDRERELESPPSGLVEDESDDEPPEFDLRTGRLVPRTEARPMAAVTAAAPASMIEAGAAEGDETACASTELARLAPSAVAVAKFGEGAAGGVFSPGARFLKSKREWAGLGSDFGNGGEEGAALEGEAGARLEGGIAGVARGYAYLEDDKDGPKLMIEAPEKDGVRGIEELVGRVRRI